MVDTHDLIKQGKVGVAFRDILMGALVLTMSLAWRSVIEKGLHIVVMQSHWFDDDATDKKALRREEAAREIDLKTHLASATVLTVVVLGGGSVWWLASSAK